MEEAKNHYLKGNNEVTNVDSKYKVLENANALILLRELKEFRSPDFDEIKFQIVSPLIFDDRNQYNVFNIEKDGFEYFQIGKASI
jgi:UDPglucose 6-dehydrogenase